jgi:hypothetical protein
METEPVLYQLTLSSRQMSLVAKAVDLWDRTLGGQFHDLEYELKSRAPAQSCQQIEDLLEQLHIVVFPKLGPGGGDFTFPGGKLAFNIRKTIEHAVSWHERPPGDNQPFRTVNYDGPISGWWEGEPEAKVMVYEGDEAVRIRDQVNRSTRLWGAFSELIGTEDVAEATKRVAAWKAAAASQNIPPLAPVLSKKKKPGS